MVGFGGQPTLRAATRPFWESHLIRSPNKVFLRVTMWLALAGVVLCAGVATCQWVLPIRFGYNGIAEEKFRQCDQDMEAILTALGTRYLGDPPEELSEAMQDAIFVEKLRSEGFNRNVYRGPVCVDPWGNPYRYRKLPGKSRPVCEVYSCGPNGKDEAGSGDDMLRRNVWAELVP